MSGFGSGLGQVWVIPPGFGFSGTRLHHYLREENSPLRSSTLNILLLNLCFSNLIISFLVKPICAIYIGYALSTGKNEVSNIFVSYMFTKKICSRELDK